MSKESREKPKKLPGKGFRMPEPLIPAFHKAFDLYALAIKRKHGFELSYTDLMVSWIEEFVLDVNNGTAPVWPPRFHVSPKEEAQKPPPKRSRP
jgi:hypothetical protein